MLGSPDLGNLPYWDYKGDYGCPYRGFGRGYLEKYPCRSLSDQKRIFKYTLLE